MALVLALKPKSLQLPSRCPKSRAAGRPLAGAGWPRAAHARSLATSAPSRRVSILRPSVLPRACRCPPPTVARACGGAGSIGHMRDAESGVRPRVGVPADLNQIPDGSVLVSPVIVVREFEESVRRLGESVRPWARC